MLDQIVAGLVLLVVAGLVVALYLADRRVDKLRLAAAKADAEAHDKIYEHDKAKLDEVINELDQKRQEHLRDLNLLKHAEWRPSDGPGRPTKL